jgi:hypothetical protein
MGAHIEFSLLMNIQNAGVDLESIIQSAESHAMIWLRSIREIMVMDFASANKVPLDCGTPDAILNQLLSGKGVFVYGSAPGMLLMFERSGNNMMSTFSIELSILERYTLIEIEDWIVNFYNSVGDIPKFLMAADEVSLPVEVASNHELFAFAKNEPNTLWLVVPDYALRDLPQRYEVARDLRGAKLLRDINVTSRRNWAV